MKGSEMNKLSLVARKVAVASMVAGGMTAMQAHAALDAAVTTAITAAQTDLLALLGALTAAGLAIWVASLIYRKFKPKA
jgi:hypothetical protein